MRYTVYGFSGERTHRVALAFNGQALDTLTGCYLLGNGRRVFNPRMMRFLSPDPYSPFGLGGLNCYAYCGCDPVNHTDPSGNIKARLWEERIAKRYVIPTVGSSRNRSGATRHTPPPSPPAARADASLNSNPTSNSNSVPGPAGSTNSAGSSQASQVPQGATNEQSSEKLSFSKELWDSAELRVDIYRDAHPLGATRDHVSHHIAALLISDYPKSAGNPFTYQSYTHLVIGTAKSKEAKKFINRLVGGVSHLRKWEELQKLLGAKKRN
ncbi:RHS repeat-associated core domain-containing protein [Pseudomonas sp. NPDC012596]|uniref:RHS repeat-associated core domain-containing protein n=1 Tax=Pseudomonas sp. NPDC012596 TaxID=3364419 RepID=UPI0036C53F9E